MQVREIAAGGSASACISAAGELWVLGKSECLCSAQDILTPKLFLQLEGPQGVPAVSSVAASADHFLAVTDDGRVNTSAAAAPAASAASAAAAAAVDGTADGDFAACIVCAAAAGVLLLLLLDCCCCCCCCCSTHYHHHHHHHDSFCLY